MCHYSIGLDNPDFRDVYDKCLAEHDKKLIAQLREKVTQKVADNMTANRSHTALSLVEIFTLLDELEK